MTKNWYLSFSLLLCLAGCGSRGLHRMFVVSPSQFAARAEQGDVRVSARVCTHAEMCRHFSAPEDLYHYYHLLHLRFENRGVVRYTLQPDQCSFFVPPATMLAKYTKSNRANYGSFVSFLSAIVFFPIYVISMFKAAVESPPYLMDPDLVVPKPFGLLSGLYGVVTLGPLFLGRMVGNNASDSYLAEAKRLIVTQNKQLSIPPYKTVNTLLLTPRAGFVSPCQVALYDHKEHRKVLVELQL